jgi:iron complex outermembrane receptor protein
MTTTVRLLALSILLAASSTAHAKDSDQPDLEALSRLPVYGASRHYLRQVDAPASVSILTAEDVRSFGYRTLGDILRSIRGVDIHNDRTYDYLALRGFARPGDYNTGVSLQIDGMRINDALYDQAMLGSEFPLDVDLIERVEYIRGPGSAEYGGNAVFGVINVVTKSGSSIGGARLTLDAGSEHRFATRGQYGQRFANGANLLVSASNLSERGETLRFAADPASDFAGGSTPGADFTRAQRVFAKFDFEAFSFAGGYGSRTKGDPIPYLSPYTFGATDSWNRDSIGFADVRYFSNLSERSSLTARAFYGFYDYLGHWRINGESVPQVELNKSRADWGGGELRLETLLGEGLRVVSGIEYQRDMRLDQSDFLESPSTSYYAGSGQASRTSVFVQTDYDLAKHVTLTAGLRADHTSAFGSDVNPRIGLIYKPDADIAWKLLYGGGSRNPSAYERFVSRDSTPLQPERVGNLELTLEQQLAPRTRLVLAVFGYRIERVVRSVLDPLTTGYVYGNTEYVLGRGIEGELEHIGAAGTHWRTSATYSAVRGETLGRLTNSPRVLLKGNVAQPLPWAGGLRVGLEGQWTAGQYSWSGRIPSIGLANLTLLRPMKGDGWEVSTSVYNLFDRHYVDALPGDNGTLTGGVIPQGGRQYRIAVTRQF